MENKKRSNDQEQVESHSLPGTNQAGREAAKCGEGEGQKATAEDGRADPAELDDPMAGSRDRQPGPDTDRQRPITDNKAGG